MEGLEAGGEDLTLPMTMKMKNLVALVVEGVVVEALEVEEEALVLQMTMVKILEALVVEGAVVVLEEEGEVLVLAIMTEKMNQVQVVALAQDEGALVVGLNYLIMKTLKDSVVEEEVGLVASEELMMVTMMANHVEGGVVEVEGDEEVVPVVMTMMATLILQNLVRFMMCMNTDRY